MSDIILGAGGMLGSALARQLRGAVSVTRKDVDLSDPKSAWDYVSWHVSKYPSATVYLCAARVGGIGYNTRNAWHMINENIRIQANVLEALIYNEIKRLVWIGSSCMYPRALGRDMREEQINDGAPEPTNAAYAMAKRAGLAMLEASGLPYLAVIPCNLYGPNDRFDLDRAHFIPAMIRRFHEAKASGAQSVTLMGDGTPRRELMHVDDAATIICGLARTVEGNAVMNVGPGADRDIASWASLAAQTVGYAGDIRFDGDRSENGVARKLMNTDRMKSFGFAPQIPYRDGLADTYKWFLENAA